MKVLMIEVTPVLVLGMAWSEGWLAERYALLRYWARRNKHFILVTVCLVLWLLVYLAPSVFVAIKPGQVGVIYRLFDGGVVTSKHYPEGLHAILPWDEMYVYDVRYQQATHTIDVLSADGLQYRVEMTLRFRVRPDSVGMLHKNVGPDYVDKLLFPVVASRVRGEIAKYRPEEVYATRRQEIETAICDWLKAPASLAVDTAVYLDVVGVHIRNIVLPPAVAQAIEAKQVQQQEMLEYAYRIEKESKERERKGIEAQGIKEYNDIVKTSLNADLIRWLGVRSMFDLAKSNNSKMVILGSGKEAWPIYFGGDGVENIQKK